MWNTVDPWTIEVKGTDSHATENPPIIVDSPKLNYSQPSVSVRDPPLWIPKSSETLKSLLGNGVRQRTQLLLHVCGFATAARKCYFWSVFGWIYKCKPWGYGGPTGYLLKNNPRISRPGQFKPVQGLLLLLPFDPAQGRYLANKALLWPSHWAWEEPAKLWAWSRASPSPQYLPAEQQALLAF